MCGVVGSEGRVQTSCLFYLPVLLSCLEDYQLMVSIYGWLVCIVKFLLLFFFSLSFNDAPGIENVI